MLQRGGFCSQKLERLSSSTMVHHMNIILRLVWQPMSYRSWGEFVLGMLSRILRDHHAVLADIKGRLVVASCAVER